MMKSRQLEYDYEQKAFKVFSIKENSFERLDEIFQAYQKLQNIVSLKLPMNYYFRLAKISSIEKQGKQLLVKFYYDGLYGNKYQVNYGPQQFLQALPKCFQDKQKIDVIGIKTVFQSLIETFHWCANFGLFIDPICENLLYNEPEPEFFVFIPSFSYIAQFLSDQKTLRIKDFDEFRSKTFQNLTLVFLLNFLNQFFDLIKQQDEDINLYKKIREKNTFNNDLNSFDPYQINESCFGVDFIYSEDYVKKKMIRYGLKQSQFLYQLIQNDILREKLLKYRDQELKLKIRNPLTQNLMSFFLELKNIKPIQGVSQDNYTPFLRALAIQENGVQINIRRNWKKINTKHELDFQSIQKVQPQQQVKQQEQGNAQNGIQNQDQSNSEIFEIKWNSWVTPLNLIYIPITQSGQLTEKDLKKFTIQYKMEMLEDKNCFLVKTCVPEIVFGIDSADDIAYFVNSIQKEKLSTNVYVDDTRKLTFYTALVSGSPGPILWDILKIMDIHQIYFYHCLDFYYKNINPGKQIKDAKYNCFLQELKNLIQDYEYESKQIELKLQSDPLEKEGF